jgi:hypothetical protein
MPEGELIGAVLAFIFDGGDVLEEIGHARLLIAVCAA